MDRLPRHLPWKVRYLRNVRTSRFNDNPERSSSRCPTAIAAITTLRCASMDSRLWW